jgi:hypothetical protein
MAERQNRLRERGCNGREGFMEYAAEVASNSMIHIPVFIKIG